MILTHVISALFREHLSIGFLSLCTVLCTVYIYIPSKCHEMWVSIRSLYYILSGDTWILGNASHTRLCTFLEARHPVAQFYIHGTVAAILWSDACMQMYSGESCTASHTWQWDYSEPMYAINQSHGTVCCDPVEEWTDRRCECMMRGPMDWSSWSIGRSDSLLRVAIYNLRTNLRFFEIFVGARVGDRDGSISCNVKYYYRTSYFVVLRGFPGV